MTIIILFSPNAFISALSKHLAIGCTYHHGHADNKCCYYSLSYLDFSRLTIIIIIIIIVIVHYVHQVTPKYIQRR